MADVLIDPSWLALPQDSEGRESLYEFVCDLVSWAGIIRQGWLHVRLSDRTPDALWNSDMFPDLVRLKSLMQREGVVEFDAPTVFAALTGLLSVIPTLEQVSGIDDFLIAEMSFKPEVQPGVPTPLRTVFERVMVFAALAQSHLPQLGPSVVVLSKLMERCLVEYSLRLDIVLPDVHPLSDRTPMLLACRTPLVTCMDEAVSSADDVSLWIGALDDDGLRSALRLHLVKNNKISWEEAGERLVYLQFGRRFLASTKAAPASDPRRVVKILSSISCVVMSVGLDQEHALRTDSGGNSPQRLRGADRAVRRNVDYDLHLHMWRSVGSIVEMASLVMHNDFSIPE